MLKKITRNLLKISKGRRGYEKVVRKQIAAGLKVERKSKFRSSPREFAQTVHKNMSTRQK